MPVVKILLRGGSEAQWIAANPVLAYREVGIVYDNAGVPVYMLAGDGSTAYLDLAKARLSASTLAPITLGDAGGGDFATLRHNETNDRLEFVVQATGGASSTLSLDAAGVLRLNGAVVDTEGLDLSAALADVETAKLAASASQLAAADSAVAAATRASEAAVQATLAGAYADAPVDIEVTTGAYSALHWAEKTRGYAQSIAGLPVTFLRPSTPTPGVPYDYTLVAADLFGAVQREGTTDCANLFLPRDLHTRTAFDGRPSYGLVHLYNNTNAGWDIKPQAGTASPPPTVLGNYAGSYYNLAGTVPAETKTFSITVPAGTNRKVAVGGTEVNEQITSHVVALTVSGVTVTKAVADTGPTGRYNTSPHLNAIGWSFPLADSDVATTHTLAFAMPATVVSFAWRAVACSQASAVTMAGASLTDNAALRSTDSFAVANNTLAWAMIASHNGTSFPLTATTGPTGTVVQAYAGTNTRPARDQVTTALHAAVASASTISFSATFTVGSGAPATGSPGAYLRAVFAPLATPTAVNFWDATGDPLKYTLAAYKRADLYCLSDGRQYWIVVY